MLEAGSIVQICRAFSAAAINPELQQRKFGGMQMVFLGDLMQLAPVSECRCVKPLYEDMVNFSLRQNSSRFNQDKRLTDGLFLFQQFRKFELTIQMRSKDRVHTNYITSMRTNNKEKPVWFYSIGFPSLPNVFFFCVCVLEPFFFHLTDYCYRFVNLRCLSPLVLYLSFTQFYYFYRIIWLVLALCYISKLAFACRTMFQRRIHVFAVFSRY